MFLYDCMWWNIKRVQEPVWRRAGGKDCHCRASATFCSNYQGIGDSKLAYYAFKLALACNNDHAEAYNNLGVLEWRRGHGEQVRTVTC